MIFIREDAVVDYADFKHGIVRISGNFKNIRDAVMPPMTPMVILLLALACLAVPMLCVQSVRKVRADNRVAAACERIADALEGNIPALPLVPSQVEVKDIRLRPGYLEGMDKAAERAVKMTDKELAVFEKDLNIAERDTIKKLAGQLQGFMHLDRAIAPASDKNHVPTYCRDVEYVRDGKVFPEACR
jgi:hypothetical protein